MQVIAAAKKNCKTNPSQHVQTIANNAVREVLAPEQRCMKPLDRNLKRVVHRAINAELPKNPTSPDFELDYAWFDANIEDLEVISDVQPEGECGRFLSLSNNSLLNILATRKQLFVDGTFKVNIYPIPNHS